MKAESWHDREDIGGTRGAEEERKEYGKKKERETRKLMACACGEKKETYGRKKSLRAMEIHCARERERGR